MNASSTTLFRTDITILSHAKVMADIEDLDLGLGTDFKLVKQSFCPDINHPHRNSLICTSGTAFASPGLTYLGKPRSINRLLHASLSSDSLDEKNRNRSGRS
ncbi:hypothetical protein NPIL_234161 [Nephila pilipes]|uniref:Uncharacterized protein n=1 Tax=Nephila pilipes TaxID=299642 RepID=A0A8X6PZQ0_NEPPI|nr:hypothetical protein NPIL_234161 [Nephila pilipes]